MEIFFQIFCYHNRDYVILWHVKQINIIIMKKLQKLDVKFKVELSFLELLILKDLLLSDIRRLTLLEESFLFEEVLLGKLNKILIEKKSNYDKRNKKQQPC